jgi:hypothetical protein
MVTIQPIYRGSLDLGVVSMLDGIRDSWSRRHYVMRKVLGFVVVWNNLNRK